MQDESRAALAEVRKGSGNDWALLGYAGQTNALQLVGTGSGGLAALRAKLDGNNAYYGLLRTTEKIDDSVTTKFVFVICIGEAVKVRALLSLALHTRSSPRTSPHIQALTLSCRACARRASRRTRAR